MTNIIKADDGISSGQTGIVSTADTSGTLELQATSGLVTLQNVTGSITIPKGTTAQRPATPTTGMIRYNTSTSNIETYNGTSWVSVVASTSITSVTSITYSGDDLAVDITNPLPITITGANFEANSLVYVDTISAANAATSLTYSGTTQITCTPPAKSAASYNLWIVGPSGRLTVLANGLLYSGTPNWSGQSTSLTSASTAVSIQLSAAGDTPLVYTLVSGTLPTGVTLNSSGLISGTATGLTQATTFSNLVIRASDPQNQDASITINLTVQVQMQISRSLRFNSADSAYLNRTPASASNRKTWTWSGWVKRSALGSGAIFSAGGSAPWGQLAFSSDLLIVQFSAGSSGANSVQSVAVFRDCSAWYHIVLAIDTTQATDSNRIKMYVNNVAQTFQNVNYPAQNFDTQINNTVVHRIGSAGDTSPGEYFNGYITEINFIDGQQLTPSSFGQTNATTGVWEPLAYTGNYGTNGYYLNFSDNSNTTNTTLGKDYSNNGNNWTLNNFSVATGIVSIASATGGLPVLNTTDTYGTAVGSGARSDSSASSLVLAVPGATSAGLLLTDQIPTGRTQAAQTITNNGTSSTTTSSKFYSGSATVANGQDFSVTYGSSMALGTTFTVEFWANPDSNAGGNEKTISTYGINATDGYVIMVGQGGAKFRSNGQSDLSWSGTVTDWTHFAFVASGGNSKKIYVNGTLVASNSDTINANGAYTTYIGSSSANGSQFRFTGQWQDYRIYKNLAKYTSNFTVVRSIPDPVIIAGNDSVVDSPTSYGTDTGLGGEVRGNYCVFSTIDKSVNVAVSNGGLDLVGNNSGGRARATMAVSSGKWYFEFLMVNTSNGGACGFMSTAARSDLTGSGSTTDLGVNADTWGVLTNGTVKNNGANGTSVSSISSGQIGMFALDMDSGKFWYGVNGTWSNSGNPVTGANPVYSNLSGYTIAPGIGHGVTTVISYSYNFGQRPFAYTAPSGFKALCTQNLPTPAVVKGSSYFNTITWSGDSVSGRSLTGVGFQPDWVWIKNRNAPAGHNISDAVRGANKRLNSDNAGSEVTNTGYGYTSTFNSDGFVATAGNVSGYELGDINMSGRTYVAWNWKANGAGSSNTAGTITSTVSANQTSGFSIVSYTGNGSATATVGHGLGTVPAMFIVKSRSDATDWIVYHKSLGNGTIIKLNSNGTTFSTAYWQNTTPSSTLLYLNGAVDTEVCGNGRTFVAYCFAEVPGYSAFGSYTGNGSTDGPFIYLGFRPRYMLFKLSSTTENWHVFDTARSPYNVAKEVLYPNLSNTEGTNQNLDFVSNGLKIRDTGAGTNSSGATYIYAAFAENPFKYSLAR